jgi:orotidine-5'-phosphate decarboxylase
VTEPYLERLARRSAATGTVLCLGLDPDPRALPDGFAETLEGVERFAGLIVEAAVPFAAAVKANLAFFEAFGAAGIAALERIRALVPSDVPFIADAKRADIGSTAARQVTALYDSLGADAVTLNPYLGADAIRPFIESNGGFAYVLCRTSNATAPELQSVEVGADAGLGAPAEPLYARVARLVEGWDSGNRLGLVVGATAPLELGSIRAIVPGLAFLVPGVGAQGGAIEPVLTAGPGVTPPAGGRAGGGLLVNVSRGIAGAGGIGTSATRIPATGSARSIPIQDVGERLASAAAEWAARLPVLS